MRTIVAITVLLFLGESCKETTKQEANQIKEQESIFSLHDTLKTKREALPVHFDTLYFLARQILKLADSYDRKDTLVLSEIYRDCAVVLRLHCDCEGENAVLCCPDTTLIVDSYKKAINVHYFNNDTLSTDFTDALYQLADVYEQLEQPLLSLPLRQQYLAINKTTEDQFSETIADAYMFLGTTYELLEKIQLADDSYQRELEIREKLNAGDLIMVKKRIEGFRNKYNIQHKN